MDEYGPPFGFAIRRNGSCLTGECKTSAGKDPITSQLLFRCCPTDTCSNGNTGMCCPEGGDCREKISNPEHCANETWDLYQNYGGGYFCCEQGLYGFNRTEGGVGCGTKQDLEEESRTSVSLISLAATPTPSSFVISSSSPTSTSSTTSNSSTTSSTSPISSTSPSSSSSPTSSSSSSSNAGPIAGGVVGGVAGLAIILALLWYFMRRRPQKQSPQAQMPVTESSMLQHESLQSPGVLSELDGRGSVAELPSYKDTVHEMPESGKGR